MGGDHKVVGSGGAELAAGGDLQQVIVPGRHHGQLQLQRGDLYVADIIVAVQMDYGQLRGEGRLCFCFLCGVCGATRACLPADRGLHV